MDTILINEVGDVDGGDALERRDVAQIIYNRKTNSDYNHIDKEQDLYPLLKEKLSQSEIDQEEWLNVLFKKGEFSFTYAYIPGVIKIVCPDISKKARNLQSENVSLSLATLTNPQKDFTPLRYFSRASMLGRINMASIWENFEKYPERAGLFANGQEILNEKLKLGQYQFLYSFNDPKNEEYWVIQVGNKIYGVRFYENTPIFYFYRNPHDFTYFSPVIEEK
jgi:hypothetical protein